MTLDEAYEACRDIAREEARNFYYGFILLPPEEVDDEQARELAEMEAEYQKHPPVTKDDPEDLNL